MAFLLGLSHLCKLERQICRSLEPLRCLTYLVTFEVEAKGDGELEHIESGFDSDNNYLGSPSPEVW